ncbi:hypothetical protein C8F04DRAFT_951990 [Mycena alexandri]|uniref:F-box domain-containing protein n=1 Tax=Mycena alexandri TaxID=1745969 RepID=A0AAD6T211_9AGAR|nr:hypothetical protein C8F04DRAFT_951990 [Mycena alexandri]
MERPNLPVELLCQVLYLLEVDDLLRCGSVNRYFRNLVRESSRLQFTLELAKHRMLSLMPPAEFPSFSTRLKLLRDRERNWRSPEHWGEGQKLTLPPTGTVYEFVGGYYANGREDEHKVTSGISFFQLPSTEPTNSEEPLKTWTHAMGGLKIVDFTFDPPQDLLVLVTLAPAQCESVYQLHLRSFATNEPHPDSSLPMGILPCLPKVTEHQVPLETTGAVRVQVSGDLVALLVKEVHDSVSAHLQIWNWRHGSHYSCAMARMAGIEDFTFLSDFTFLIVRPSGRFECYTFENPISYSTAPVLKSSYNLPPLQDGFMYWYICMSSNPAPGQVPRGGEGTGNRVYYPRPDERIHACCLYIFKPTGPGDHHVHSFVFFLNVKIRSRQMHVRSLLVGVQTVPWEAWGPQNTRWFDEALSTDWQHALYGLKTVECIDPFNPTLPRLGPAQRHLRLRDYNPYSLRASAHENGEDESRWTRRIVTTPSTTPSRGVFMHDIVSSLPYSEVISKEKFNVTDVMMDDCRVLLMQRGKGGKLKGIDILMM